MTSSSSSSIPPKKQDVHTYYKQSFPARLVWKWMSFDKSQVFHFMDTQMRFTSADSFHRWISEYCPGTNTVSFDTSSNNNPHFLVYTVDLCNYKPFNSGTFPVREMNKAMWIVMTAAMVIIMNKLEHAFGLSDVTFFYNGGTIIYAVVRDEKIKTLTEQERERVYQHLQLDPDLDKGYDYLVSVKCKLNLTVDRMEQSILDDWKLLEILFCEYCEATGIFCGQKGYNDLLDYCITYKHEHDKLVMQWYLFSNRGRIVGGGGASHNKDSRPSDSQAAWWFFKQVILHRLSSKGGTFLQLQKCLYALVFYYMYPRIEVCKYGMPVPFTVSDPSTNKLLVPIVHSIDKFEYDKVPTLSTIVKQLNEIHHIKENEDEAEKENINPKQLWRYTDLASFINNL